jgi:four helix bundle protein
MTERELLQRTKQFALRIFKRVGVLPQTIQGSVVAAQLIMSGTSVAANYRAACRARSKPEFVAKLGVVEEEADESAVRLELIIETDLFSVAQVASLLDEASEIVATVASSKETAAKSQIANRKSAIR